MSDQELERERLKQKELSKNPGGALNDAIGQAHIGSPSSSCLTNIGSIVMIIVFILIVKSCTG
ncbi:DUF6366 family protein [Ureibacillus acetophenoni]|uniref:Uncharacterized protein n=1 Tax=Ureibacillus acetophenoni TaxID=614649 RepID=A0A285UIG7_9BACL|nr:DUF6366 family protein [Ureibacillus acetophenoni]SOC41487.1 hypothetical protein SAMN05877842_11098 [Ureibacillus acetophenoni]